MNTLLLLSLHGSIAFLLVWAVDGALAGSMSACGRRCWWWLVPASFLISIPFAVPAAIPSLASLVPAKLPMLAEQVSSTGAGSFHAGNSPGVFWFFPWLAGALVYLGVIVLQTGSALRRWSGERLSTDSTLLGLLEDCKQEAGITAPIGLVVTDRLAAPAILGWLRPRILLPGDLAASLTRGQLRAVLFHELAHFRFYDVPLTWAFTFARALHWFNPLVHLAFHAWTRFREEAADEAAILWSRDASGAFYGQALLCAIRQANGAAPPFGALAIGESVHHLKRRLVMIHHHHPQSPRLILAGCVFILLAGLFLVRPIHADDAADPKAAAVAAMQDWLKEIDGGQYGPSWTDASPFFQKAITSDKWTEALNSVRTPLGKCTSRVLASALHQTEIPGPTGTIKGDFVVAQFNSSFDNLVYAVETVSFEKTADGSWKADGYYIKPRI